MWPAWSGRGGTYWEIHDLWWTPKSVNQRWESKSYDWVFIQELPMDVRQRDFVWAEALLPTAKMLKNQRWRQEAFFLYE